MKKEHIILTNFLIKRFVKDFDNTKSASVRTAYGNLAGVVGIVCNAFLCISKLIAGTLSHSVSITADAVNNLSDASSSVITLIGFKLSARPADNEHPYGHARIEYLAGLCVSVMILAIGIELARTSIEKIMNPTDVAFSFVSFAVLILSIAIKLWMSFFNRSLGKKISSSTLEATAADSRNDVITTSVVLIAALIAFFTDKNLDGIMGLAVAIFILYSGIGIIRETMNPLLGAAPDEGLVHSVAQKILSYPGVLGTHDLMVHDYGPGHRFASVHVEMDAASNVIASHDIIDNIERDFRENDNLNLVIHYDPILVGDAATGTEREKVKDIVHSISPKLSIHDFRMVPGETHTNLIFDVVTPHDLTLSPSDLKAEIQKRVSEYDTETTKYYTVVTVDTDYACLPK